MNSKVTFIEEKESADWLYTFADLMTLLLVFFVLLFSLSSVEADRFEAAMRSLNKAFQGESGANSVIEFPHEAPVKPEVPDEIEEVLPAVEVSDVQLDEIMENEDEKNEDTPDIVLKSVNEAIRKQLEAEILSETVGVELPKDGKVVIKVNGDLLFSSGSVEFNPKMMPVLDSIMLTLKKNPDIKLGIQGHTDNVPIATARFPSNWDLSAIRATNVLRYMVRGGLEVNRVSATGYGDSRPLVLNDSVENRAKNRRLEFVLEKRL